MPCVFDGYEQRLCALEKAFYKAAYNASVPSHRYMKLADLKNLGIFSHDGGEHCPKTHQLKQRHAAFWDSVNNLLFNLGFQGHIKTSQYEGRGAYDSHMEWHMQELQHIIKRTPANKMRYRVLTEAAKQGVLQNLAGFWTPGSKKTFADDVMDHKDILPIRALIEAHMQQNNIRQK